MSRWIDADALQRALAQMWYDSQISITGISVSELIHKQPSIDIEPKRGEWVRTFDGNEWFWYCSNCKTQWYEDDLWMGGNEFPTFCPNCGARMKGADHKTEPQTTDYCDGCNHKGCDNCVADGSNPYCVPSNYEPQTERSSE